MSRLYLGERLTVIAALFVMLLSSRILSAARPNVLLIVSDDQRPDTIHALGN